MIKGLYSIFDHWHSQGTCWIYSDPHFGDKDLLKYGSRPSDEEQVKQINSKVGKKDTLIILGDCGDLEVCRALKGYKILIAGNHEKGLTKAKEIFDEVYAGPVMISEKLVLSHEPLDWSGIFNIHGHVHDKKAKNDATHYNVCAEHIGFEPVNFHKWMKEGHLSKLKTVHRSTIDRATARKKVKKWYE